MSGDIKYLSADDRLEIKSAQAYQVIGNLLDRLGLFESPEGQRALDYFSGETLVDEEFLPWPKGAWLVAEEKAR